MDWYQVHKRSLPWRETKDPYKIWLSEIILQQTRVAQGLPYYQKFVEAYPSVKHLAEAHEDEVLKLWEGLGYYSRARNMHAAAKQICSNHKGKFPETHQEILNLKGVGDYTAAAIASFAFNLPHAVLDGNVYRVLSRVFGIETPINKPEAKRTFTTLAQELLPIKSPADYNQAIMEFGALQCKPKNPVCSGCPLKDNCIALQKNMVSELPKKVAAKPKRERYFYYLQLEYNGNTAVQKRGAKDIWQGLYEFALLEFEKQKPIEEVLKEANTLNWLGDHFEILSTQALKPHILSHQKLWPVVLKIRLQHLATRLPNQWEWVDQKNLLKLPMPVLLRNYLDENQLPLPL